MATGLVEAGLDAVHVRPLGLAPAPDDVVFDRAAADNRVVVSADTDFGAILAARQSRWPSVVLFRGGTERRPTRQVILLLHNLEAIRGPLEEGALVVIEEGRIRIRLLPFGRSLT